MLRLICDAGGLTDAGESQAWPGIELVHIEAVQCWPFCPRLRSGFFIRKRVAVNPLKVGRQRVFLLAARPTFKFPDWLFLHFDLFLC